jgi:superfamily II DNA/RNA helicase
VSTTTAGRPSSGSAGTTTFADLGVEPALCEALAEVGITSPFPIQEMTLPLALTGADIIGQARTGTGKTLGFGLPLLQRIDTAGRLQALVVVPTRELCLQVAEDLAQAGRRKGVKVVALYGGKAMQPQIDALGDGAHLVVGTPGRLLDLCRRGFLDLSGCRALVLDEADEMLDLGFLPDVEQLVERTSAERQTLLFSATMPSQIVALARRYMTKPTFMRADVETVHIAPKTRQFFFSCHRMDKPAVLARILQTPDRGLCVVFCRTKRMADILAEELRERDVAAQAIHSDLRQDARERVMQKFRDGSVTVLCATEVAARGLDIDDVTHVVNYDCPDDEKMYLHRIGRTGRAGADGVAVTLAVWNELPRLDMIRRELDIDVEVHEVFSTSPLLDELFDLPPREQRAKVASPPPRAARDGRSGRRAARGSAPEPAPAAPTAERDASAPDAPAQDADQQDAGGSRRRTRTRTRRGDAPAPAATAGDTGDTGAIGDPDAQDADRIAEGPEDEGGRRRRRSRRGRGGRGAGVSPAEAPADEVSADRSTADEGAADGAATGATGRRERDRDRGQRRGADRSTRARGDGRDRGDGARGRDRDRDRGQGRRGPKAPVDHLTARGEGRPRLRRPLEVLHLP